MKYLLIIAFTLAVSGCIDPEVIPEVNYSDDTDLNYHDKWGNECYLHDAFYGLYVRDYFILTDEESVDENGNATYRYISGQAIYYDDECQSISHETIKVNMHTRVIDSNYVLGAKRLTSIDEVMVVRIESGGEISRYFYSTASSKYYIADSPYARM